jgi:cytochrome c1
MSRKIVLSVLPVLAGAAFLLMAHDRSASAGHMMGGGMMSGGMMGGGMMGQTPENNGSQLLPDQQSKGAKLYRHYCSQCHALPSPRAHTAKEWPSVVARMKQTMVTQGKTPPDNEQLEEILGYLQQYAK